LLVAWKFFVHVHLKRFFFLVSLLFLSSLKIDLGLVEYFIFIGSLLFLSSIPIFGVITKKKYLKSFSFKQSFIQKILALKY